MNGECCFARAGSGCYAHWKAGKWNRARILSCINLHVPKLKQVSGILTLGPRSTCHAFGHPDPNEGLLCVLCAACVVSHLSPLKKMNREISVSQVLLQSSAVQCLGLHLAETHRR